MWACVQVAEEVQYYSTTGVDSALGEGGGADGGGGGGLAAALLLKGMGQRRVLASIGSGRAASTAVELSSKMERERPRRTVYSSTPIIASTEQGTPTTEARGAASKVLEYTPAAAAHSTVPEPLALSCFFALPSWCFWRFWRTYIFVETAPPVPRPQAPASR
ncbi:hypothetical protein BDZ91DRAFT_758954 [Kalaharituber pfeilii]|nr:hypothetical protein BDZ91DRAFT_758954 [Kalaharituber pfeilii]